MARNGRTDDEVAAEIAALRRLQDSGLCRSNTRVYIGAQVLVLTARMSHGAIFNMWGGDGDEPDLDCLDAALDTIEWRDGNNEPPSKGWAEVIG